MNGLSFNSESILNHKSEDHYILIGDSYGAHHDDGRGDSWSEYFCNMMGLNYYWNKGGPVGSSTVTKDTDCWCAMLGGRGFIGNSSSGAWLPWLQENYPSNYDKLKVTKIIIVGGYNDHYSNESDISTAMESYNTWFNSEFPNAHIYLACVGMHTNDASVQSSMYNVAQAYEKKSSYFPKWTYITGLEGALHNTTVMIDSDYHHPKGSGSEIIARGLKNVIFDGSQIYIANRGGVTFYSGDDYTVTDPQGGLTIRTGVNGRNAWLSFITYPYFQFSTPQGFATATKIFQLSSIGSYYFNSTSRSDEVIAYCYDGTEWKYIPLVFRISTSDNYAYLRRMSGVPNGPYTEVRLQIGTMFTQDIYLA